MKCLKDKLPHLVLLCAIGFLGIGIYRGEVTTLFEKAIAICLECVGIG